MASRRPMTPWRWFLDAPNDSPAKTLTVALLVALIASAVVSVTAVTLKPLQLANLERERQARLAEMVGRLPGMEDILRKAGAESLEVRIVNLAAGTYAADIDPVTYDQRAAATDPALSTQIPAEADIAEIKRRANYAAIYIVRSGREPVLIVLPVHGAGYQSTLYAYLALEGDANTIAGLTFYEQGDTPGMGARIQEPEWLALWPGKQIADENGEIRIDVIRGQGSGPFEVDGISGATRTGYAVADLIRFWLGDYGFGPFLAHLKAGEL